MWMRVAHRMARYTWDSVTVGIYRQRHPHCFGPVSTLTDTPEIRDSEHTTVLPKDCQLAAYNGISVHSTETPLFQGFACVSFCSNGDMVDHGSTSVDRVVPKVHESHATSLPGHPPLDPSRREPAALTEVSPDTQLPEGTWLRI